MRKHVVYYFSGTGNSLKTALTLQGSLGDCDVIPMGLKPIAPGSVETIGFVFPCYMGGVPKQVQSYVKNMDFSDSSAAYVYAISTYGAMIGATLGQFNSILNSKGVTLDYSAALKAFSNYVVLYEMSDRVAEKTSETKESLQPIITEITNRKKIETKKANPFILAYNSLGTRNVAGGAKNFICRDSCDSCGICTQVCIMDNIELVEGKPHWLGHCERCLACLHWCPKRAIDYGNETIKRGRYKHPEITLKMFISFLRGEGIDI